MQEQAHAQDIHYRVQGAYLMEVDQIHRPAMHLGLRPGDAAIYGQGIRLHRRGQGKAPDQPFYIPQAPVGMGVGMDIRAVGVLPRRPGRIPMPMVMGVGMVMAGAASWPPPGPLRIPVHAARAMPQRSTCSTAARVWGMQGH